MNEYSESKYMNSIDAAILGFLSEKDMHGYEIFKYISYKDGFGAIYSIKIGRLYSILNKLEESGYIHSEIDATGARPPKKVYKISPNGEQIFKIWLESPVKHGRDIRITLLIKLFFADKFPKINFGEILRIQIMECQDWLQNIQLGVTNQKNEKSIQYLVKEFRKSQIEGYINWLKWCKRKIADD